MLFSGTYTYLKTVGNGGKVQNASGYDIIFTSDAAGSNLLTWEIESYNASTGVVNFWIKIPSLSASVDTVIYMWYGNSAISSFQGGSAGAVWDSNYKQVIHCGDGSTLDLNDKTTNGNNATNSSATAAAGKVGLGSIDVTDGSKITMANGMYAIVGGSAVHTLEFWVKSDDFSGGTQYCFDGNTTDTIGAFINFAGGTSFQWGYGGSGNWRQYTLGITTVANTWYHFMCVKTAAGDNANLYLNGAIQSSWIQTIGNLASTSTTSQWGAYHTAASTALDGNMDEMRISNTNRSASWAAASYNSQNSPSTFYTIGNEQVNGIVGYALIVTKGAMSASLF